MKSHEPNRHGFGTRAIHAGQPPDPLTGAVMMPIYQTSTYAQESPGVHKGYEYARTQNPTRKALEECLASLERGKFGTCFASGLAATEGIIHALLQKGDHVLCSNDLYGGTFRIFDKVFRRYGVEFSFVDLTQLNQIEAQIQKNTKMIWLETPTNPMLSIIDVAGVAAIAKKRGIVLCVDNTFASPYFQNPLAMGAEIVVHSVTKYINGHSDVVGGAVVTSNSEIEQKLKFIQNAVGAVPSPHDCFLILRGVKTLHVRMERHAQNAMALAEFLERHSKIERVLYPGLSSHPQHALAKKQMCGGFGGMITFFVKGDLEKTKRVLESFQIFTLAESLGGVESLIEHPAIMTHASVPAETRKALGIHDNLIRASVGIEDFDDLKTDLEQALTRI